MDYQVDKILDYHEGHRAGYAYAKLGWKYTAKNSPEWKKGFQAGHDIGCLELFADY